MSTTERRQIENEMIFRRANEKIVKGLKKLDTMHKEDGNHGLVSNDDLLLHFNCECSDENCDERIPIKISKYQKIHQDRKVFILKPNHQVNQIEKVVQKKPTYSVVKKMQTIDNPGTTLNQTSISNV